MKHVPLKWRFEETSKNEKEREPVQGEFFNSAETLDDTASLVREAIQNSLDARRDPTAPVHVTFTCGQAPEGVAAHYFGDLREHAREALGPEAGSGPCDFLLVEDSNTTGLTGGFTSDTPESAQGPFYNFTWKEGSSNKKEGSRGKWGIGKYAFKKNSSLRGCVVLTTPEDSRTELLMGLAVLKYHNSGGVRCRPDGFLAEIEPKSELVQPYSDREIIAQFRKDWRPVRPAHEPGLTVLVPYTSIKPRDLVERVARDYFVAILAGELVVTVRQPSEADVILDVDTLEGALRGHLDAAPRVHQDQAIALLGQLDNAKAALRSQPDLEITVPTAWQGGELTEEQRANLLEKFDSGEPVVIEVHTSWRVRDGKETRDEAGKFRVSLRRLQDLDERPTFCREGILIPEAYSRRLKNALGLVVINSGQLADLLGYAEGPAHEKWSKDTEKFVRKGYVAGDRVLDLVKQAPRKLLELLRPPTGTLDLSSLAEFFPKVAGVEGAQSERPREDSSSSPDSVEAEVQADRAKNAVILTLPHVEDGVGVISGYRSGRRGTLTWTRNDFVLVTSRDPQSKETEVLLTVLNGTITEVSDNKFRVVPTDTKARPVARLEGFDPNRVVMVDVRRGNF